ncbi:MAG: phenylpyruvate tautomerase MIF-related protein [Oscillospiraceae bacterium]|nr:phenylpyruvate tautomerase MIF-related protein [Oscillospiraceae bacterium]
MPYLQLNTSVRLSDTEKHDLCEEIGKIMPAIPGKTRQNTMMYINDGCYMEMGDAANPMLNLEVRLLGNESDDIKKDYIGKITKLFEDKLKVQPSYMYINLIPYDDWGVNGSLMIAKK